MNFLNLYSSFSIFELLERMREKLNFTFRPSLCLACVKSGIWNLYERIKRKIIIITHKKCHEHDYKWNVGANEYFPHHHDSFSYFNKFSQILHLQFSWKLCARCLWFFCASVSFIWKYIKLESWIKKNLWAFSFFWPPKFQLVFIGHTKICMFTV